jgi:hypothetical protein
MGCRMIKFVPKNNIDLDEPYCADSSALGYIGYDLADSSECGRCVFHLNDYSMNVDFVTADDDEIAEGLIRSALNYCANRGAYIAYYLAEQNKNVAAALGFSENNGKLNGEIPELLKGSCCKNN